jgi:hypothetical protein
MHALPITAVFMARVNMFRAGCRGFVPYVSAFRGGLMVVGGELSDEWW